MNPNYQMRPFTSSESQVGDPGGSALPPLALTDFLDLATLQEIQDSFGAVTRLHTSIRDAAGSSLTVATDSRHQDASEKVLDQLITEDELDDGALVAPIIVEGRTLGSIRIEPAADASPAAGAGASQAAAIQLASLLANAIARLCYDATQAGRRADELSVLYQISSDLFEKRDVQQVLETAAHSVARVMQVRAASIRLLTQVDGQTELVPRAVYNLPESYLHKGAVRLDTSNMFDQAIAGEAIAVEDMAADSRVLYPGDAEREGLVSMLCVGMVFQGRPIGTLQLFTGQTRRFGDFEIHLLRAIAQLLASAIENARLDAQRAENQRIVRQLRLAADVQHRMLPGSEPTVAPFDIAARYVPSMELSGDFYDFLELRNHVGLAIGDVVGKGVPAALLMASVRSSLRAYAQDVYDLDEIIARVNVALTQDTLDNEFATLWYGVLDPKRLRLTYCNAGHEPPILLRRGGLHPLDTGGMIVGVDGDQRYDKGILHLETGDLILLYTDGLTDAMNDEGSKFGRTRVEEALRGAPGGTAREILNHVLSQMRRFTNGRRSFDDTTLVVIRVE